ncbi:hypothetical protein HAX54_018668 [Datura stramonium]|uniref:Uncharacterized protein n=1 Tax=Datura stramonium TaxID=4076 RepID=A0ABS8UNY3_DATST|nr:hypothetical protein [Datura stramonium]
MGTVPLEQDKVTNAEDERMKAGEKDETWMQFFAGNRAASNVKNGFTSLSGDDHFSYFPPPDDGGLTK